MPDLRATNLFAGPGGSCLGAESVGVSVVGIEFDASACRTRRAAGLATIEADVETLGPRGAGVSGLMGSPPCQTFSIAGKGTGRRALDRVLEGLGTVAAGGRLDGFDDDPRTALVLEPMRWAIEAFKREHPYRWIFLEQVPTVQPVWDAYAEVLARWGYSVWTDSRPGRAWPRLSAGG